jgi:hypothetical protein
VHDVNNNGDDDVQDDDFVHSHEYKSLRISWIFYEENIIWV